MPSKLLLVLTGKTASGKDTVMAKILKQFPDFKRIITTTSRTVRLGEKDGVDYNFIPEASFSHKVDNGDFIEHVNYGGNWYGTEKAQILDNLGFNIIWRIDPSRAGQIRQLIKESFESSLAKDLLKRVVVVYLTVDNEVVLQRLKHRNLAPEEIEKRMQEDKIFWEQYKDSYDFVIENVSGQLQQTVDKIAEIVQNRVS